MRKLNWNASLWCEGSVKKTGKKDGSRYYERNNKEIKGNNGKDRKVDSKLKGKGESGDRMHMEMKRERD